MRPYTVVWCGLVSLAGACITLGGLPTLRITVLSMLIPIMGWIAGLYLSDYLDRKLDSIQKPHRPIPSGRIKPKEAIAVGILFASTGLFLSSLLNIYNLMLVFVVAALVFAYARFSKSHGIIGNLNRGIIIIAAYLFGVFSVNTPLQLIPTYVWLLSPVFLVHDTNSNLVGTIRDMQGDKKGGYITIPVKYGLKTTIQISIILSITYILLTIITTAYYRFLQHPIQFYTLLALSITILIIMYLKTLRPLNKIDRKRALRAHEYFVIERTTLANAFIIGMIDPLYISLTIYILTIGITLISQHMIRDRYEFENI
ncbi:hypothetical protein B6U70_01945 [Euryarchaeota archaeon ex4484_162]|nr:MAG: hypothetical protein B6U70_01945 [Euryarchaeota archaeon ex4484_162]RLF29254.1 MAG: hypothetical protein DRN05_02070 [Thermoplasmata archaeon]RLF35375.1 MAG: hypothetical protein DRN08_03170 [Thermoplasmata archaeon]